MAMFEATHGTAPKYANLDKVNPGSLMLSGVMMLQYMGWKEAADLIVQAIIYKPERIATRIGIFAQVLHAVAPKIYAVIMNTAFRLFPESSAAKKEHQGDQEPSLEQISFAQFTRGIYW